MTRVATRANKEVNHLYRSNSNAPLRLVPAARFVCFCSIETLAQAVILGRTCSIVADAHAASRFGVPSIGSLAVGLDD
jgi:hypothetical protein